MSKKVGLPEGMVNGICTLLEAVRNQKPLVHHITNWVTIYDCAQIVKSFGASPVMAHAQEEAADMASLAGALVLNIGTLTPPLVAAMLLAGQAANRKGIPVVLDVCGAGATPYRDQTCAELLTKLRIQIIKGNASEIARVAGENVQTKGVDAAPEGLAGLEQAGRQAHALTEIARRLAREKQATVVVTGTADIVTDGERVYRVNNGHELMTHVVGTGCMAASVIGTFAAVSSDPVLAAVAGLCAYEIAAEAAAAAARRTGPAAFKQQLCDAVYRLTGSTVRRKMKVSSERVLLHN